MELKDLILMGCLFGLFLFLLVFTFMNLKKSDTIHRGLPFLIIAIVIILFNAYNEGEFFKYIADTFNKSFH